MKAVISRRWSNLWRAPFATPKHLVRWAIFISLSYAMAHTCGLRQFTSILNGTIGSTTPGWHLSALLGLIYIGLYLAFVLLVPILLMAAAIVLSWEKFFPTVDIPEPQHEPANRLAEKDPLRHLAVHNRSRD